MRTAKSVLFMLSIVLCNLLSACGNDSESKTPNHKDTEAEASENAAGTFPVSQTGNTAISVSNLSLDHNGKSDDSAKIFMFREDYPELRLQYTLVEITLGDGNVRYYRYLQEGYYEVRMEHGDVFDDNTDALLLIFQNSTSNYASSDIHLLKLVETQYGQQLVEKLTVLDAPDERVGELTSPLYTDNRNVREQLNNLDADVTKLITGASVEKIEKKYVIKLDHLPDSSGLQRYSLIEWNGSGWIVHDP
jgi:hypothetical protein